MSYDADFDGIIMVLSSTGTHPNTGTMDERPVGSVLRSLFAAQIPLRFAPRYLPNLVSEMDSDLTLVRFRHKTREVIWRCCCRCWYRRR